MKKHDLATIFSQIETAAAKVEEVAAGVLSAVKMARASTLDQFNELVTEAYAANGWSQRIGRPAPGDRPAPEAVKMYVSTLRAGYRLELDVLAFETMEALRKAIRERRQQPAAEPKPPQLRGLTLSSEKGLTGALFRDVVVIWEHLPEGRQKEFEEKIQRLVDRYSKNVLQEVA